MTTNEAPPRRVVLITGASTGIGEACALRLDRAGWRVFAGVRKPGDGDALRSRASPRLAPLLIDVTDPPSIDRACAEVTAALAGGGLDGIVNNAGIALAGPLEFMPLDRLRRQLEVNVIGQVAVTQAFMPLIRAGRGRVVFMGSVAGRLSVPFLGPYCASKHALEAIADALRLELRPWRTHVAIVEPGSIATPIWEKSHAAADDLERTLAPPARALYDRAIAAVRAYAIEAQRRGISADAVARSVEHALTSRWPKTRYLVGTDARVQAVLAACVPDRLRDSVIAGQMKLPRTPPNET